jgi:carboxyl-terminal processing protease
MGLCVAIGIGIGVFFSTPDSESKSLKKLAQIFQVLDQQYVDKINKEAIFETTISEMLHRLDPHSNYISAKNLKYLEEQTNASFGGIGVRFLIYKDTLCITHVNTLSPAELAGLKRGDRIIEIDGKPSIGKYISNEKVMARLKGQPDSKVRVTILRKGKKFQKTLVRGIIPIATVPCAYMIDQKTGYIQLNQFSIPTSQEFHNAALLLLKKGMKNMVLDLRGNGGGTMDAAISIADEFLPAGRLILSSKGAHNGEKKYKASAAGSLEHIKLVVLIDAQSASASEILAGALQDNDRATIVGRRSFGKGLIQQDQQLTDGSSLRITVARYYTPSGRSIQRPYKNGYEAYKKEGEQAYTKEYFQPDSSIFVDSLKYKTRNGRTVYGGGGIMPDVFVPGDSTGTSLYLSELQWAGAFNAFAFAYLDKHPLNELSLGQYLAKFSVSDSELMAFTAFAAKTLKIPYQAAEFAHSKERIRLYIKAEIARHLWLEEGYNQVLNPQDKELQRALKCF